MTPVSVTEVLCTRPLLDRPLLPLRCSGSVRGDLALGEVLPALSPLLVQVLVPLRPLVCSALGGAIGCVWFCEP